MKKLMVLALVLGVVGLANAGLSISAPKTTINVGEELTITLSSDGKLAWLGYLQIAPGGVGALSNPVALIDSDKSSAEVYADAAGVGFEITTADTQNRLVAGPQWAFTFSSMQKGFASIDLYDDAFGYDQPFQSIIVEVIPEPMTMGLLALGGLFIRRKK